MTQLLHKPEIDLASNKSQNAVRLEQKHAINAFQFLHEYVNPIYFFIGAILTFSIMCAYGYAVSMKNPYKNFHRFHQLISPDSFFYPTLNQLRTLALSKVRPDQTLVVVGGNSIFNGVGQPENQVWTTELQRLLGPNFAVVNLAFRGTMPFDAGYVVAETLVRAHPNLLYITVSSPGVCGHSEGNQPYNYLYWSADARGLLEKDVRRTNAIAVRSSASPEKVRTGLEEIQIRAILDRWFHFEDAWSTIGYKHFFTVWNFLSSPEWWSSRKTFCDRESTPPPVEKRFSNNLEAEMNIVQGNSLLFYTQSKNGKNWTPVSEMWQDLDVQLTNIIPRHMRSRCLVVFPRSCPFYSRKLTTSVRERDDLMYETAVDRWKKFGFNAVQVGAKFEDEDFVDRTHLASSGGAKLALYLSPQIIEIASKNGYLKGKGANQ